MAEKEGFEPSVPCGTPDFESGTFDHSATSPGAGQLEDGILLQLRAGLFNARYPARPGRAAGLRGF